METIFDHNVTEDEVINIVGVPTSPKQYKRIISQSKAYEDIYYLYTERGNEQKAQEYLDKLPNDKHKFFQILNMDNDDYNGFRVT